MLLTGVDLGGDYERGTATVHGLSLLFTADGVTVQGPEPGAERLVAWSGLSSASCRARARQGDGTTAMVLILQAGSQTVRFFLPSDKVTAGQAAYLDQALPIWLDRYGGSADGIEGPGPGGVAPAAQAATAPAPAHTPPAATAPAPADTPPVSAPPAPLDTPPAAAPPAAAPPAAAPPAAAPPAAAPPAAAPPAAAPRLLSGWPHRPSSRSIPRPHRRTPDGSCGVARCSLPSAHWLRR